ncbi:MAG: carbohydrate kinase [Bacteroidetes bacterium]|jgi:fructokinase|nr:carbohydrate kinase [Bacteroidota bacterium]
MRLDFNQSNGVVCFGEILWDMLPHATLPGGAPMNVAYHLNKLGINASLISKTGDDTWGQDLRTILSEAAIDTKYTQIDSVLETGKVLASVGANHEVTYDIKQPVAWDAIEINNQILDAVARSSYFVYGSLASRSPKSYQTLLALKEVAAKQVFDINLRAPHYSRNIIETLLSGVHLLKMNEAELALVASWYFEGLTVKDQIKTIRDRFNIHKIVVTLGAAGAIYYENDNFFQAPTFSITVADTIGSGDAFLAGFLQGLLHQKKPSEALAYAAALGALVATQHGACPNYNSAQIDAMLVKALVV